MPLRVLRDQIGRVYFARSGLVAFCISRGVVLLSIHWTLNSHVAHSLDLKFTCCAVATSSSQPKSRLCSR